MLLTETIISTFTGDYIVQAYVHLPGEYMAGWHKVMNFGTRQGDAIDARRDFERMETARLFALIRAYDGIPRMRIRPGAYRKQ